MAVLSELHDYILTLIEKELSPGEKLPGARTVAERFSCSLPRVQTVYAAAYDVLCTDPTPPPKPVPQNLPWR